VLFRPMIPRRLGLQFLSVKTPSVKPTAAAAETPTQSLGGAAKQIHCLFLKCAPISGLTYRAHWSWRTR
jgi:hypothetical protein